MKKDGFTLIELLAVIIVLGILALIVTISTSDTINNSKNKLSQIQIQKVEEAAKMYYLNEGVNESLYNSDETRTCVNVSYLTENDYIEASEIKNPKDNSDISGSVKIIYENKKYKYEYQDTECNHSDYFVSVDAVCDLVSDADSSNSVTIGDKYQCKVKEKMETGFEDGYYFYVLSYNDKDGNLTEDVEEAKTINLIMDRNINSDGTAAGMSAIYQNNNITKYNIVPWQSSGKTADGPVTAIQFLYNATKDWINVEPITFTYKDRLIQGILDYEKGYTSIISIKGVAAITNLFGNSITIGTKEEPLRARIPIYISTANQLELTHKSEAPFLYDNLYTTENVSENNLTYGYWTLSTYCCFEDIDTAWFTYYTGYIQLYPYGVNNEAFGVRPVITLGL